MVLFLSGKRQFSRTFCFVVLNQSLTLTFQGAFSEPGAKTVIPRKVTGKFSVRIVPNQTPEIVEKVVVVSAFDKFNILKIYHNHHNASKRLKKYR